MKQPIIDYLASKVIEDIRQQRRFNDSVADNLNKYPLMDSLRELIQQEDVPILLEMTKSMSTCICNLAISLLRKFDTQASVKLFFLHEWSCSTDYERRSALMWRLLDDKYLDITAHEDIYRFVCDNMNRFLSDCAKCFGGDTLVLSACKARLADPSFPRTKDWIYLCASLGSTERDSVKQLIASYESSKDKFVAKVSKDLSQRLTNKVLH
ncbi:MAG: hypothetical protein NUV74_11650 [Candidatus Brocadiaceae bacterium]|nr:hypothetical protein [Candidatus Brocadiaceae bacterium]